MSGLLPDLMSWRIRRRKAISRDLPGAIPTHPEDEELLICLGAAISGRMVHRCSRRISARESPLLRQLNDFSDSELHVQSNGFENRIVGYPERLWANCRWAVRRHENTVFSIEAHHCVGTRCIQGIVVIRK